MNDDLLLEVSDLRTHFFLDEGVIKAVNGVDFKMYRNRTMCVVGESGCGKSVMARSLIQIVAPPGKIVSGQALFHREVGNNGSTASEVIDLTALKSTGREIRDIRGQDIAMIFQEPMTSMSPVHTIGNQLIEAIRLHEPVSKKEARERAIDLLGRVGIPKPELRIDSYSFQMSGGMLQRTMIAMALSCRPTLLIADEPTTALDVTTQAQILELMLELQEETGMAIMLITHDLGVVAEMADDVIVMYLGEVVEQGSVDEIFFDPKHPYTQALLRSIPTLGLAERNRLDTIRGMIPHPFARPDGCQFHNRCDQMMSGYCDKVTPQVTWLGEGREVRCLLYTENEDAPAQEPATEADDDHDSGARA
jgi:oligopeptide/dipeptide ABC transporter ATP-binding protein